MTTQTKEFFICEEVDEMLKRRVDTLTKLYLIKNRKRLIYEFISKNFSKFMREDRLLTSDEVINMLQISRQTLGRRIKDGKLLPINPEAKRNYRFKREDVYKIIEGKGGKND